MSAPAGGVWARINLQQQQQQHSVALATGNICSQTSTSYYQLKHFSQHK
jgi:hypothetical protein